MMKAVRIHQYGAPEVMQIDELPMPIPQAGEALVHVEMASVNFIDIQHRRGDLLKQAFYNQEGGFEYELPAMLGSQGVGVIEAVGDGVSHVKIGERVIFYGNSYATHVVVPADRLIPVPDVITVEQAAAGLSQGFIAYELSHAAYPIKQGDWCLIHAAAGGIGLFLIQMAKLRGGKVIAVVSNDEKAKAAHAMGADEVILSTKADIAAEARRITGGQGVNVVYDGVGKDTFNASLDSLAPCGYLMVFGQASGFVPPFDIMTLQDKGSLFISRNSPMFYTAMFPQYMKDFVTWVRQGKLQIKVDHIYPLAEVARAHAAFEQRQTIGRVLLVP